MLQLAHVYHLVTHSPWPLLLSIGLLNFTVSAAETLPRVVNRSFLIFSGIWAWKVSVIPETSPLAPRKKAIIALEIKLRICCLFQIICERQMYHY